MRAWWLLGMLALGLGTAAQARPPAWDVALMGDIMMGTDYPAPRLPPEDGARLWEPVAPLLEPVQLVFGNLEGPLTHAQVSSKRGCARCYAFRTPPRYASHLAAAGFTALSLANNHANDFGAEGAAQTQQALASAGVGGSAAARGLEASGVSESGHRWILLAFSTGGGAPRVMDHALVSRQIAAAATRADWVFVSFHAGAEGSQAYRTPMGPEHYLGEARGDVRAFATMAVAAGADVVFGHGPHVPRGMEVMGGRLVAYSLGNFLTYGPFATQGLLGISPLVRLRLDAEGSLVEGDVHFFRQHPHGLEPLAGQEEARWLASLSRLDFGDRAPVFEGPRFSDPAKLRSGVAP